MKLKIETIRLKAYFNRTLLFAALIISCNGTINLNSANPEIINPTEGSQVKSDAGLPFIYEAIDTLFGKFVTSDRGLVDYHGIHEDSLFVKLKDSIAQFDVSSITIREDSLAFYINAYNVMVIYYIMDYGLTSQAVKGFPLFQKKILIGRERITLDQLEKKKPAHISKFNDPRTHFAIVCAALSCPPLLNKAYRGETLYRVLDEQTSRFLNTGEFNTYHPSPSVSALFDWYAADFKGQVRDASSTTLLKDHIGGTVNDYISSYLTDVTHYNSVKNNTLTFKDYDWTINNQ